jgi:hypothetical protein
VSEQLGQAPRQGSSSQGASSTSSTNSADQGQRPAEAGSSSSQNPTQASDSQKRPQQGSSQSATGSQDNQKTGSGSTSTATDSQPRSTTGSSQQQSTQSGSASGAQQSGSAAQQSNTTQQSGAAQQNNTSSTSASSNTTSGTSTNAVASLGTEQRSEVTQAFSTTSVNTVSSVNFNVSVGTIITDEVRLAPLPAEVIRIVPQYRNYQYVVVRDEIVIVEPRTKKIVEVIHKSGGSRKSASVSLSSEQRKKFKTTVETTGSTRPSTTSKIEIREGIMLPEDVEIMEVPQAIITEVPELRTYRYVVIGDEIAVVEPETRRVIEVIE